MFSCFKKRSAPSRTIYVVNHSTRLDAETVSHYVAACNTQLRRDVCSAWFLAPMRVSMSPAKQLPLRSWVIALVDDKQGVDNAYGYHSENKVDLPVGFVLVETIYAHSPEPVNGPTSVPSVLSHEVAELAINPQINTWFDSGHGYLYWGEICDPVQRMIYNIRDISVSDFVLPAWFDYGSPMPYDHLRRLRHPGEIAPGGYMGMLKGGQVEYKYGNPGPPGWMMEMKNRPTARPERLAKGRPV